jgi:hypothetical protein
MNVDLGFLWGILHGASFDGAGISAFQSRGVLYVRRTTITGITERLGYIPVQRFVEGEHYATAAVKYGVTLKTGEVENVLGGTIFAKVEVLLSLPCHAHELVDVERDLAATVGDIIATERAELLSAYNIEHTGGGADAEGEARAAAEG